MKKCEHKGTDTPKFEPNRLFREDAKNEVSMHKTFLGPKFSKEHIQAYNFDNYQRKSENVDWLNAISTQEERSTRPEIIDKPQKTKQKLKTKS